MTTAEQRLSISTRKTTLADISSVLFLCIFLFWPLLSHAQQLDPMAHIAVQHKGRIKPLDTVARETLKALTGKETFDGEPSVLSFDKPLDGYLSLIFRHREWAEVEMIKVRSKPLKRATGLDPDRKPFSPIQLRRNEGLRQAIGLAFDKRSEGIVLSEINRQAIQVNSQLLLYDGLSNINSLALVPPDEPEMTGEEANWRTLNQLKTGRSKRAEPLEKLLDSVQESYLAADPEKFTIAAEDLQRYLREINPEAYPAGNRLQREVLYNRLKAFKLAMFIYFIAFIVWLFALGVPNRGLFWTAWVVTLGGLLLHLVGFILRGLISGHVPVTNMYESLVFTSLGIILFSLLFELVYKSRLFGISGSFTAAIVLVMSRILPIDSSIGVLVPVLRSNFWLLVHVVVIMLSYSAFTQAWALGHVYLIRIIFNPAGSRTMKPMASFIYRLLQAGVLLLASGIILGAMWANISWGRYWGWDPKETWSLICLFGYLALLHARYTGWIRDRGLAVGSVLAFMLVVMCYYGVNFLLNQGLHSYGAGSGGLQYAIAYILLDIIFFFVIFLRVFP